ncbi:cobalt-zinc-cadmium efflux system membrane fusion protein [Oxalobacteraceae bacterium GrIS 1.11]
MKNHAKKIIIYAPPVARQFLGRATLLAAVWLPLAGCHQASGQKPEAAAAMLVRQGDKIVIPAASPLRARLAVGVVGGSAATHTVALPGVVEADPARAVNIVPPLTGRLLELRVRLGDTVKQGQVLAVIGAPDLAQAFADADKARDARELTRRALRRARGVNEAGANASKDLEQIESNDAQAAAESARAEARLRALGADAAGGARAVAARALSLRAPLAGTITALNVGAGAYLNDANAVLMSITNLEQVWVTANVPENLVAAVAKGQAADVSLAAYPGQVRHGTVAFVGAVLEADTRRNKARIAFANPDGKLKPNMFASVDLLVPQAAQMTVPSSALLMNNDSTTVFVEVAPWTFVRRSVELGTEDGDTVRVVAGLRAGERVVVRGGVLLND